MTQAKNQTAADSGAGTEIVPMPAELDLATSEGVPARGCAAIARLTRLVLLDLPACHSATPAGSAPSSGSLTRPTRQGAISASSRRGRWPRGYCGSGA